MEYLLLILMIVVVGTVTVIALAHPGVAMVLFLTAPMVKLAIMLAFPVARTYDYTAIVLVILGVSIFLYVLRHGLPRGVKYADILVCLVIGLSVLLFTYPFTPSPRYGFEKLIRAGIVVPVGFIVPVLYFRNEKQGRRLLWLTGIVGLVVAVGTIVSPQQSYLPGAGRGTFLESNPIGTGVTIGLGVMACLALGFDRLTRPWTRVFYLACIPLMMLGIFFTGSRGPLIGVVLCTMLYLVMNRRQLGMGRMMVIVLLGALTGIVVASQLPAEYWPRFLQMFGMGPIREEFSRSRTQFWVIAWRGFLDRPFFGYGVGSFSQGVGIGDFREYPHNMFLELLYEGGLAACLPIAAASVIIFIRPLRPMKTFEGTSMHTVLLGFFLMVALCFEESMKSGDLSDNRQIWFWAGCVMGCIQVARTQYSELLQPEAAWDAEPVPLNPYTTSGP